MAASPITHDTVEMEAVLRLSTRDRAGRETLEAAAIEVERVLDQQALDVTGGVSASANLASGEIEIDVVLCGETTSELYGKLAHLVAQLERHCDGLNLAPAASGTTGTPSMTVHGSQLMRIAAPDSATLATTT